MTGDRITVAVGDVRVGDRLVRPDGSEMTVTRIDSGLLGRSDLVAFVEDTEVRWLKQPLPLGGEVEIVRAP